MGVVRHSNIRPQMSALGQKQTSKLLEEMSALPPKADIHRRELDIRFVPKSEQSARQQKIGGLFDHLVSAKQKSLRYRQSEDKPSAVVSQVI
jgi:hypothetical protein